MDERKVSVKKTSHGVGSLERGFNGPEPDIPGVEEIEEDAPPPHTPSRGARPWKTSKREYNRAPGYNGDGYF